MTCPAAFTRFIALIRTWLACRRQAVKQIEKPAPPPHGTMPERRLRRGLWPNYEIGSKEWYQRRKAL